jgi:hypothetical protein
MSNTLLTPQIIVNELLRRFQNSLAFTGGIRHEYDGEYGQKGAKVGDTINLRIPVRFGAADGATLVVQDVTELKVPLQLNKQKHVGFSFTSKDLTLTVDRFGERYLDSAAVALANQVDLDGLTAASNAAFNAVGTPGAIPTALKTYNYGSALLDKSGCPFDEKRSTVITPDMQVEIVDALKGLFESGKQIRSQYEKGRMGHAVGLDWKTDQNCITHTYGPQGGVPVVNTANQVGSTLLTRGWTTAAASRLNANDRFTIPGVYMVNPVSGAVSTTLQTFVVNAAVASAADGTASIQISPAISLPGQGTNGINPYATVSNSPADGAAITVNGAANVLSPTGLIYHRDSMAFAMAELELPQGVHFRARQTDPDTGMSIRIVSMYDIVNDLFATRCDIIYGFAVALPQWLVAVQS